MQKTLLLCLSLVCFPAFSQVDLDVIERFQQLSRWLEREEADLKPFARFYTQHQGQGPATEEITTSLYLQACVKFEDYHCALKLAKELLALTSEEDKILQLLTLGVQLSYQTKQYQQALKYMNTWEQSRTRFTDHTQATPVAKKQLAELYTIAAYSANQLERWQMSEHYIKLALNQVATKSRYLFQLAVYQHAQELQKEHQLLGELTQRYPNEDKFWLRLAQNSILINKPKQAIAALSVLENQNKLDENQRILLAQLQIRENTPESAYTTLSQHTASDKNRDKINKLKLHSLLLSRQRDKAMALLETQAMPNRVATQAQLAFAEQQWHQAIPLLAQQMVMEPAQPRWRLLKAMAHFELDQYVQAKREFSTLLEGKYASTAQQWLDQIQYLSDSE